MTVLSQLIYLTDTEISELKQAVSAFDFFKLDSLDYDPDYPELNLYNPIDKQTLITKLSTYNTFRFTIQEWYLTMDAISDKSSGTLSFVYDMLWQLNNSFFFVD